MFLFIKFFSFYFKFCFLCKFFNLKFKLTSPTLKTGKGDFCYKRYKQSGMTIYDFFHAEQNE